MKFPADIINVYTPDNTQTLTAILKAACLLLIAFIFAPIHVYADADIHAVQKVVYPDGSIYIGGMIDGIRHGDGRFIWPDGSEYRGGFYRDKPHGKGIHWYSDGRRRNVVHDRGRLVSAVAVPNDQPEDGLVFAELILDGRYRGWCIAGPSGRLMPHGRGTIRFANGSIYSGQWEQGRMHGNGIIRWSDGSWYAGQWRHGKRDGFGTYVWPGGERYTGGWRENEMTGEGSMSFPEGRKRIVSRKEQSSPWQE